MTHRVGSSLWTSLRFRLLAAMLLIGLVPYAFSVLFFFGWYRNRVLADDTQEVLAQGRILNSQIVSTGYMRNPDNAMVNAELGTLTRAYDGRILVIDENLRIIYDTYDIDDGRILVWENAVSALNGERGSYYDKDTGFLSVTMPILSGEDTVGCLLVMRSMDKLSAGEAHVRAVARTAGLALLALVLLLSVYLSDHAVRPLLRMQRSLDELREQASGALSEEGYLEAQDLAAHFNEFLARMQTIDDSRQEFVSNVSHELKTPLASMKVLADSLNAMPDAPVELYRDFMADITAEIERENGIINDLLEIVRMDKSGAVIHLSECPVNDEVELVLKRLRPIAEEAGVELVFESFRPVTAEIDRTKFSLAVTNLVENAIKYNNPGGWVHVSLNADHQNFFLRVEDNGLGIPEESLSHIFERFYRVDKSHSREIGGSGLGLAIAYSTVLMHHGQILVDSEEGEGSTFDVRIPLSFIPREGESWQIVQERPEDTEQLPAAQELLLMEEKERLTDQLPELDEGTASEEAVAQTSVRSRAEDTFSETMNRHPFEAVAGAAEETVTAIWSPLEEDEPVTEEELAAVEDWPDREWEEAGRDGETKGDVLDVPQKKDAGTEEDADPMTAISEENSDTEVSAAIEEVADETKP